MVNVIQDMKCIYTVVSIYKSVLLWPRSITTALPFADSIRMYVDHLALTQWVLVYTVTICRVDGFYDSTNNNIWMDICDSCSQRTGRDTI